MSASDPAIPRKKLKTAALSIISNSALILLKVIAGSVTGSVAILTEAVHSSIDLVASVVAFVSVRKADAPADQSHRYGHEKIENLAAAIEGILILVGSAAIAFEAVRHLINPRPRPGGGAGHRRDRSLTDGQPGGIAAVGADRPAYRLAGAGRRRRPPGTDALTSAAVLVGLVLVDLTGAQWIDPVVALLVVAVVVATGVRLLTQSTRVLVDEALPTSEVEAIRDAIAHFADRGVVGYHELRTRRAGSRRYVDLHIQFRGGT